MKIMHYALGFPPYRTGGLTKFVIDLAEEQKRKGHDVCVLWPGTMKVLTKRTRIVRLGSVKGIDNFEIVNPLPVSLDEGIVNIARYTQRTNPQVYIDFLNKENPDVIHVHTLMGLHKELLDVAHQLKIRLVYTTHDYFPICPKVTLMRNGNLCDQIEDCSMCAACNKSALPIWKVILLQSAIYRKVKDSKIIKTLRRKHRNEFFVDSLREHSCVKGDGTLHKKLRKYYNDMLKCFDIVHYNSSLTKAVYERYMGIYNGKVLSITHAQIKDHRTEYKYTENIKISYLGPQNYAKGYFLLKNALDKLYNEHYKFVLNIYFEPIKKEPYMEVHEAYNYDNLQCVYENSDVVVVPSIWFETFGFTMLEALSYGVPVICSSHVGAKDILPKDGGIVFESGNTEELYKALKTISKENLQAMNIAIMNADIPKTVEKMADEIEKNIYQGEPI